MDTVDLLKQLSETPGPSGYEQPIATAVAALWEPLVDAIKLDRVGSLLAVKQGQGEEPGQRILLAAHMDEIALMVTQIEAANGFGFLRTTRVGGVDVRHLYGQRVVVHGQRDLTGVLGALPNRLLPKEKHSKPYGHEELVVDVGLPEEEVRNLVSVGDFISFRQALRTLSGTRVTGKALDNRASVAAVTHCLDYLNGRAHTWDVVAVATAQEETRLLGAYTSAFAEKPDLAIAIDVTFAKGAMLNDGDAFVLGAGPVLEIGPNVHPGVYAALQDAAKTLEMSVNVSTHARGSGTDAFGLQIARDGIPTGLVSIPLRYMHTMVEMIDTKDVERAGRLLGEFIARLDADFLDKLATEMMAAD